MRRRVKRSRPLTSTCWTPVAYWFGELQRAPLGNGRRVEYNQVGPGLLANHAAVGHAQTLRGQLRQAVDALLQRQRTPLAHETPQVVRRPGVGAEETLAGQRSVDSQRSGVRLGHARWMDEGLLQLFLFMDQSRSSARLVRPDQPRAGCPSSPPVGAGGAPHRWSESPCRPNPASCEPRTARCVPTRPSGPF